ncbi:MAG TPA: GGDEF domain-containing protein [Spirochaetales bacterium]|nr:GGDEF domain-containing protein [Spirochaetales bacterium]
MPTTPDSVETFRLLRQAELFAALLDDDLAYVASRAERLEVPDGAALFGEGDEANRFFVVRSGEVLVSRSVDGARLELARFGPDEVVGDFDFAAGTRRDARASAVGPTSLLVFPHAGVTLETMSLEKPDTTARILLRSLAMVAGRIRAARALIAENSPWVRELRRRIHVDAATGLRNRAWFDEELAPSLKGGAAFVLLKPERFKELVDARGHAAGDLAMSRIAARLLLVARAHPGGEALRIRSNETAVIVPGLDAEGAVALARTIAGELHSIDLSDANGGRPFPLAACFAIALWPEDGAEARRLLDRARDVLLKAWQDGGGRVYRVRPAAKAAG